MTITLLSLTLLTVVGAAAACSCSPASIQARYYAPENTRVVRALVTLRRTKHFCKDCKVLYDIKVREAFKGCNAPADLQVSSAASSSRCGVDLQVGTEHLMYLSSAQAQNINDCQGIQRFSDLSITDMKFLRTRKVCCGGQCSCLPGTPRLNCFVPPCNPNKKPPCQEADKCVSNFCGGCLAEWFQKDGSPACV
jgi:hypothetical protein